MLPEASPSKLRASDATDETEEVKICLMLYKCDMLWRVMNELKALMREFDHVQSELDKLTRSPEQWAGEFDNAESDQMRAGMLSFLHANSKSGEQLRNSDLVHTRLWKLMTAPGSDVRVVNAILIALQSCRLLDASEWINEVIKGTRNDKQRILALQALANQDAD